MAGRSDPGPRRLPAAVLAALLLLAASTTPWSSARAQVGSDSLPARPDSLPARSDTAGARPDSTPGPPVTPLGAFARSLVLPGWGQAEVDRPGRGAVYFGLESVMLWMGVKSQAKLSSAQRGSPSDTAGLVEARTERREDWITLSVFVALMSGVDAWVATHLYGFESELEPPEDGSAGAQLTFRVPLGLP